MADKKAQPQPAPKQDPDAEPLKETEVEVKAVPGGNSTKDRENTEKVIEKVKQNIEKAIEEAAPGGAKKQLDAADEEIDKARDSVPKRAAKQIRVTVRGTDGHGDKVERVDYEQFGMVTAAPGGDRWYHQHFNASPETFRLTAWFGPNHPTLVTGLPPGAKQIDYTGMDVNEGGTAIPYWMEDPRLRAEFEAHIAENGGTSRMDPALYEKPADQ